MSIEEFAEMHRVRVRRDGCGDAIIPGKRFAPSLDADTKRLGKGLRPEYASHIYDNGDGRFGICLMFDSPKKWGNAKRKAEAAGFIIKLDCTSKGVRPFYDPYGEGLALFEPSDKKQARLALKLTGARVKREMAPEAKTALVARFALARTARAVRNASQN